MLVLLHNGGVKCMICPCTLFSLDPPGIATHGGLIDSICAASCFKNAFCLLLFSGTFHEVTEIRCSAMLTLEFGKISLKPLKNFATAHSWNEL